MLIARSVAIRLIHHFLLLLAIASCVACVEARQNTGEGTVSAPEVQEKAGKTLDQQPGAVVPDWPLHRGDAQSTGVARSNLVREPSMLWQRRIAGAGFNSAAIVVEHEGKRIGFLAEQGGKLFALDLATGDSLWEYETPLGFDASPSWCDGRVYIGDVDGKFYCLDASGKLLWSFEREAPIDSGAAFYRDLVLFTCQDSFLYALDRVTGEKRWEIETGDQLRCSPTIIEGKVFLAGCDALLHIVDLDARNETGTVEIFSPTGATPAASGDFVVFGTEQAGLLAVNWKTRELLWKFDDNGQAVSFRGNPAISGDRVVMCGMNRSVYCLSLTKGEVLWRTELKSSMENSPIVVGDVVYVATNQGRLNGLELETGELFWDHEVGGGFTASPVVAFEKLLIGNKRGVIQCFGKSPDNTTPRE